MSLVLSFSALLQGGNIFAALNQGQSDEEEEEEEDMDEEPARKVHLNA